MAAWCENPNPTRMVARTATVGHERTQLGAYSFDLGQGFTERVSVGECTNSLSDAGLIHQTGRTNRIGALCAKEGHIEFACNVAGQTYAYLGRRFGAGIFRELAGDDRESGELGSEEFAMMPVVAKTLSQEWWDKFEKSNSDRPPKDLAYVGHWLLDGLDDEHAKLITRNVPVFPRFVLTHFMGGAYHRQRHSLWAGSPADRIRSTPLVQDSHGQQGGVTVSRVPF